MKKRRNVLIVLGVILLVACVAVAVFAVMIVQEKKEIRDNYGSEVAKMCDAPGGGAADLANLSGGADGYRFLLLTDGGLYHDWHDKLPGEMRAADGDQLDVVVCFQERSDVIERCPYYTGDNEDDTAFTLERIRYETDVILLDAKTGARIYETTLIGSLPDKCPDEVRGRKGETQKEEGAKPTYNDFYTELLAFVEGAPQQ